MAEKFLRQMLHRVGVTIPERELRKRAPHELSLAEKWALERVQGAGDTKMPPWLKPWAVKS